MKVHPPYRANSAAELARVIVLTLITASLADAQQAQEAPAEARNSTASTGQARVLPLDDCLNQAMQNNRRRPASRFAVAAAEAQHRQALAAYWPQISAKGGYQRMDESPNFLFPASSIPVPAQTLPLPPGYGLAIVDPANNVVGSLPGFPAQSIQVPAQDIKLMDENSFMASLNAVWLLYDGGMRKGYREQTRAGIEAAKQELRRTELEITDRNKEGWTVGVGIELPLFEGFLTRIFQHGFTTRKEGHGFGLHSDALAAKELGGSLTAHRDGPGTGATFTLELPVQKRAANTARAQGAEPAGLQLEAA